MNAPGKAVRVTDVSNLRGSEQSDTLAMLDGYGIVVSLHAIYEWGGYRYSNARDAIAAAKRGQGTGAT